MTCTSKSERWTSFFPFLIVAYLFVPLLFFLICYEKAVENLLVIVLKKK